MRELAPQERLWQLLRGAAATQAAAVAAALGIADELADGERSAAALSVAVGAEPDALRRILRALASEGIFEETEPAVFRNTPSSELLARDGGWRDFAILMGGSWYRALTEALQAVRTGDKAFPYVFGTDFWTWLDQHPDEAELFDRAMSGIARARAEAVAAAHWQGDETVVDVGGGDGTLLLELLRRRPGLRGIVLDRPQAADSARAKIAAAGLSERCQVVPGSFFERVPAGDAYVLAAVLHDWDDPGAVRILRAVHASAPPHARLVIVDGVIQPANQPDGMKWLDVVLLVSGPGRVRTETEWRALLGATGFRLERVRAETGLLEAALV